MRFLATSALLAAIGLTYGCAGGDDESADRAATKQARSADGLEHPAAKQVRSTDPTNTVSTDPTKTPISPVVPVRAQGFVLTPCPAAGPGGANVHVVGISCEEGSDLLLGVDPDFEGYRETQEVLYRPSGKGVPPVPAAKGWTCWARFDKTLPTRPVGVIHVICWQGDDLLLFEIG